MSIVQQGWVAPQHISDAAKVITAKFKNLRRVLREWQSSLSNLKMTISNVKLTLYFILFIEQFKGPCKVGHPG